MTDLKRGDLGNSKYIFESLSSLINPIRFYPIDLLDFIIFISS